MDKGGIAGKVVNAENSRPLPNTLIVLLPNQEEDFDLTRHHDFIPFTLTDEEGEFGFRQVPAGEYTVLAVHLGFLPARQQVTVLSDEVTEVFFALEKPGTPEYGSIAGQVTDEETGDPIKRAWVRLVNPEDDSPENRRHRVTRTNARGFYRFGHVKEGEYGIVAAKRGYLPSRKPVEVVAGERTRCDLALTETTGTGTLSGKVFDALTNEPIVGALVALPLTDLPQSSVNNDNALTTRTDELGCYNIPGVPVGLQKVIAMHPDYFPDRKIALVRQDQETSVSFLLNPRPPQPEPLVVCAIDAETSEPVKGVKVHLALQEDIEPNSDLDHWGKVTKENGKVVFPRVPQADFVVIGEKLGYETAMESVSVLDGGATVTLVMVKDFTSLETSDKWYFACGSVSDDYQSWLLVVNPSTTETVNLALTLYFTNEEPLTVVQDVDPNSRFTFNLKQIIRSNIDTSSTPTAQIHSFRNGTLFG